MTDLSTNDVQGRTLTAFFDTREAADTATADLVAAGIPREHIQVKAGAGPGSTTGGTTARDAKGFWGELKDVFLPDEDRYGYAEGLSRGGYLLSVRSDEANYTRIMEILDRDGAVDMDEREASWRQTGWSGYQAGTVTDRGASSAAASTGSTATATTGAAALSATAADTTRSARGTAQVDTLQDGKDEVIPIYEETANVAKRDVNHGRVRLRSYVVETPFSQQVNLRNEQVQVERRPVDRPIAASDAVFQDRVIEAEEHAEEAIISKEARVTEEIGLRKTVENQAQTLTDTVRRTEVEVEDTREGRAVAGAQGLAGVVDTSRIAEHMPVIALDGLQIGTVDHLDGPDKIKLTKTASPDGQHHHVPLTWIDHVDTHVHLNRTAADVKADW